MAYAEPINKYLRFNASYMFSHSKANEDHGLYDVYTVPEDLRPTPGDSLQYVSDLQNSYYSDSYTNQHRFIPRLQGTWDKVESAAYTSFNFSFRATSQMLADALKWDKRSGVGNNVEWY